MDSEAADWIFTILVFALIIAGIAYLVAHL